MGRTSEITRNRLVATAEQLFARDGIDVVSLREINQTSGSRNAMAVQYHFQDRAGVLRAILAKHQPAVEARRHAMLDQYEADGEANLRALAAALVRPSASKLSDSDGGLAYLQIAAELLDRPHQAMSLASADGHDSSMNRWRALVIPLLSEEAVRLHRRFAAMHFTASELARRARSGPHRDDRLFVSHLIDLVTGLLAAQVSDETLRLAAEKDAATIPMAAKTTGTTGTSRNARKSNGRSRTRQRREQ